MRTAFKATAFTALALLTAAPTALATNDGGGGSPGGDHAKQAERLMQAADKFDKKAGSMRTRAGRLRATALELRLEAEELAGNEAADPTTDPAATAKSGRQGSTITTTTTATTTTTTITTGDNPPADGGTTDGGGTKGDGTDESFADPDACAWDGEDDLGFSREADAPKDDAAANAEEICHLLRMADRLEQRAGALDAGAARMQEHATKLREKAAKLLAECGAKKAERMLKKAAALRQAATTLRAQADTARDAAFQGTDVDDDAVASIRRMELKAGAFDKRADRLEARAAALNS